MKTEIHKAKTMITKPEIEKIGLVATSRNWKLRPNVKETFQES